MAHQMLYSSFSIPKHTEEGSGCRGDCVHGMTSPPHEAYFVNDGKGWGLTGGVGGLKGHIRDFVHWGNSHRILCGICEKG